MNGDLFGALNKIANPQDKVILPAGLVTKDATEAPPFSLKEMEEQHKALKKTKTPGHDGFSAVWLQHSFCVIKHHILALFNACLRLRYFPAAWKCATVLILKKNQTRRVFLTRPNVCKSLLPHHATAVRLLNPQRLPL